MHIISSTPVTIWVKYETRDIVNRNDIQNDRIGVRSLLRVILFNSHRGIKLSEIEVERILFAKNCGIFRWDLFFKISFIGIHDLADISGGNCKHAIHMNILINVILRLFLVYFHANKQCQI